MLKKIAIQDVRTGMYLQKICGDWLDHPFWKAKFQLTKPEQIAALQQSKIAEVWIDVSKGCDVLPAGAVAPNPREPAEAAAGAAPAAVDVSTRAACGFDEEIKRARSIRDQAKAAVVNLFGDARLGNALDLTEAATVIEQINGSIDRNTNALISLLRLKTKDDYTYLHSVSVCALMVALAKQLGLSPALQSDLGLAGLLHDIGKVAMPAHILNKPGKLTADEFETIKQHPVKGAAILRQVPALSSIAVDVCAHHHERVDGAGYPDRLSGEALSLHARMGAVCDVYDAVTSVRCYKESWEPADAIRKMASWKQGHFDDTVFNAFVKMIGIYPVGTLVKLKSGKLGLTVGQSRASALRPLVRTFFSTQTLKALPHQDIDLSSCSDAVEKIEEPGKWAFDLTAILSLPTLARG